MLEITNSTLNRLIQKLQKTQDQLVQSEKMSALGNLVAGVAHEINTPIGIGVTASSFLDQKTKDISKSILQNNMEKKDLEKYIHTVGEASSIIFTNLNRAAELVQSFKQVAVDQSSEEKRSFRLKKYINGVLISLKPYHKQKGHIITVSCNEELILDSYPGVFSQIVTNLVMNS
ncbi:hypothetical protein KAH94_06460, partial [bacterium]|nr:hypothetical protein [bacterium]